MSRIGKKPVLIPPLIEVSLDGQTVAVKGPKGQLAHTVNDEVLVKLENNSVIVMPRDRSKNALSRWGLSRSIIENLIVGVTSGFQKRLEISGVGYRAAMQGRNLQLSLGYSHEVIYEVPQDVTVSVTKPTEIIVSGISRQQVGQVSAEIRKYRLPEPYKGKGIKYANENIVRKEGKKK